MKKRHLQIIIASICLLGVFTFQSTRVIAQENEWNTWTGVELSKKISKGLEFSLNPEVRFTDQFTVDKYLIETGLEYKLFKFLKVGAKYRYLINERETKSTEYFSRFAFDLKGKYNLNRFGFQLRTRYTNYNELDDEDNTADNYLRYRFKIDYNLPNSKITPLAGVELFHHLEDQEINKIRYFMGAEYKLGKKHRIGIKYLNQDYIQDTYQKNIISIGYKLTL